MKYPLKGVGNVSLKLNQGNTIHLQDVLYVPYLKKEPSVHLGNGRQRLQGDLQRWQGTCMEKQY